MRINSSPALVNMFNAQVLDSSDSGGVSSMMLRIPKEMESKWLDFVTRILPVFEYPKSELLVCRRYVVKSGSLRYGWMVMIVSPNAKTRKEAVQALHLLLDQEEARPVPTQMEPVVVPVESVGKTINNSGQRPVIPISVSRSFDNKGRLNEIVTVPLAHVNKEMNIPKPSNTPLGIGKGAIWSGGR